MPVVESARESADLNYENSGFLLSVKNQINVIISLNK